ncbi:hypothetical protein Hdeb2414_s0026g00680851 [Helianthus debilis subsp. tardiflorus]
MAAASSWNSTTSGRSNALCSCGAATCIRTSCTEANRGRRFLCCMAVGDFGGLIIQFHVPDVRGFYHPCSAQIGRMQN